MARARYETGTSPRKLEPDYKGQPKKKKSRLRSKNFKRTKKKTKKSNTSCNRNILAISNNKLS